MLPNPNYPFLPLPQTYIFPYSVKAAEKTDPAQILVQGNLSKYYILLIVNC